MSSPLNYHLTARLVVFEYVKANLDKSDPAVPLTVEDVYIVWFAKTLQNWKALLSTTLPDGKYYELTYNGDKDELYLDAYAKFNNKALPAFSQIALGLHEAVV